MISTIQAQPSAYVKQSAPRDESSKGVQKTEKSEALDKVAALKEQIQNGTYQVDIVKTANAIAEELI
jgi:anti-sigma28 factor (negative regulator of flagellin synthesis)